MQYCISWQVIKGGEGKKRQENIIIAVKFFGAHRYNLPLQSSLDVNLQFGPAVWVEIDSEENFSFLQTLQTIRNHPFLEIKTCGAYCLWLSSHQANQTDWEKIQEAICEKLSTFYPRAEQSISMAIQKGNAVFVRGCPKKTSPGLKRLFNFHVQKAELL